MSGYVVREVMDIMKVVSVRSLVLCVAVLHLALRACMGRCNRCILSMYGALQHAGS